MLQDLGLNPWKGVTTYSSPSSDVEGANSPKCGIFAVSIAQRHQKTAQQSHDLSC
jgi:hypothetical protein